MIRVLVRRKVIVPKRPDPQKFTENSLRMPKLTNVPRMLTIPETVAEFKLPEHFIRKLCSENKIVYVKAGKRTLINADKFVEFLNGEAANAG